MYNRLNQYRCIIIRGKSQKEIDDLLPAYAKVIDDITPCEVEAFSQKFNELLANLIYTNGTGEVWLNQNESDAIQIFASDWNKTPEFDVYSFDLSTVEGRKQFELEWTAYFGKLSDKVQKFETTASALGVTDELPNKKKETSGQQHGEFYCIYRVYFVRGRILMYVINNIHQKQMEKKIDIVPLTYRIDFGKDAIDQIVIEEIKNNV